MGYGCHRSIYWILTVTTTVIHFTNLQHINQRLVFWFGITSLLMPVSVLTVCRLLTVCLTLQIVLIQLLTLNCSYPCLHLLKRVFRQPSREHLVEVFGLSVVQETSVYVCVVA
jgi:uncharacterized membrane protein YagU involved in acid resistance